MAGAEMATSATEQPDAVMHSTLAVQPEVYAKILAPPMAEFEMGNQCGVQQWHVVGDAT